MSIAIENNIKKIVVSHYYFTNCRYWEEYNKAVISIKKKLVFSSQRNLTYIAEITDNNKVNHKMVSLITAAE